MIRLSGLAALAAALLAGGLAGCSENQPGVFGEPVIRPSSQPRFTSPSPGATGVSPRPKVEIGYEDVLDPSTVNAQSVRIVDLTTSQPVGITIGLTADRRGFTLQPLTQLIAPRTFEVRVLGRTQGMRFGSGEDVDDFTFRFTTGPDPQITNASLPSGSLGAGYNAILTAAGGTGTRVFRVQEGTLPNGLSLNLSTGQIAGTPAPPDGTYTFVLSVTDGIGRVGLRTYTVSIAP